MQQDRYKHDQCSKKMRNQTNHFDLISGANGWPERLREHRSGNRGARSL